jgi:sugar phosphate isomerase/epimerase
MEDIRKKGYRHLELARAPFDPEIWEDIGRAAAKAEISIESTQIKLREIEADLGKTIEMHRSLPCRRVVISVLPLRLAGAGAAAYHEFAGRLNRLGEKLRDSGLELLFHHHHFEFLPLKDEKTKTGMDILIKCLDPHLVKLVLDTYWLQRGGENPGSFIRRIGGMGLAGGVHLRDYALTLKFTAIKASDTCVGKGRLDFTDIYHACNEARVAYMAVEQDSGLPWEDISAAYSHMKSIIYNTRGI